MPHHDRDAEIAAFILTKGVNRCPTACVAPPKARLASPIKRRSQNTQLPATNCCGRKSALAGKFSALCGFGIEPWCRSCNSPAMETRRGKRDPGVSGRHPAVLGRDDAVFSVEKEGEAALGLPPGVHSYALLPIGYPMGRFGAVRRIALTDVDYEDRWGQTYRDL